MSERIPGEHFQRTAKSTPEDIAEQEKDKQTDELAETIFDTYIANNWDVSDARDDAEAAAWEKVETMDRTEVRAYLLDPKNGTRPATERHAYAMRWNLIRGIK